MTKAEPTENLTVRITKGQREQIERAIGIEHKRRANTMEGAVYPRPLSLGDFFRTATLREAWRLINEETHDTDKRNAGHAVDVKSTAEKIWDSVLARAVNKAPKVPTADARKSPRRKIKTSHRRPAKRK